MTRPYHERYRLGVRGDNGRTIPFGDELTLKKAHKLRRKLKRCKTGARFCVCAPGFGGGHIEATADAKPAEPLYEVLIIERDQVNPAVATITASPDRLLPRALALAWAKNFNRDELVDPVHAWAVVTPATGVASESERPA